MQPSAYPSPSKKTSGLVGGEATGMGKKVYGVDDVVLDITDVGSGRPVLFIHGWPMDHRMWEYQWTELPRQGLRCIGLDLRGFGASDQPWDGYDYDTLADDVEAVLSGLDIYDAGLVGFALGGAVAIRYLRRHGTTRVSSLALLGAAAPSFTKRTDFPFGNDRSTVDDLIRRCYADRPAMVVNFGKLLFNQRVSAAFANWFNGLGFAASGHATVACAELLRDADLRADLPVIRARTLILHATHDRVCPFDLAQALQNGISGSQLISFDQGGHGFFYEERDRVNVELVKFFQAPRTTHTSRAR